MQIQILIETEIHLSANTNTNTITDTNQIIKLQNDMTGGMCFLLLTGGDEEKLSCVQRFLHFPIFHFQYFYSKSWLTNIFNNPQSCLRVPRVCGQLSPSCEDVVQDAQDHQGKLQIQIQIQDAQDHQGKLQIQIQIQDAQDRQGKFQVMMTIMMLVATEANDCLLYKNIPRSHSPRTAIEVFIKDDNHNQF